MSSPSRRGSEIGVVVVGAYIVGAAIVLMNLGGGPWTVLILVGPALVFGITWLVRGDLALLPHIYIPSLFLSPSLLTELENVSKGIRADHIVIGLALVLLAQQVLKDRKVRVDKILITVMLLYVFAALITLIIRLLSDDSPDAASEIMAFQGLLRPFIVFFVFLNVIRSEAQIRDLLLIAVGAGGIVIGFMMLQYLESGWVIDLTAEHFDSKTQSVLFVGRGAVVGTFDGLHNSAGIFAMVYVTTIISIVWSSPKSFSKWLRFLIWTLIGFTFVTLLATFSRSAGVAMFVSLVTLLIIHRKFTVSANLRALIMLGVIGLVAIAFVQSSTPYVIPRFGREIFSPTVVSEDPRFTTILPGMWRQFLDNPLLGRGSNLGTAPDIGYMTELAARGVIGFALYFGMIFYVLRVANRTFMQVGTGALRVVSGALTAMTFGLLAAALGNDAFWSTRLVELYWIFVASTVVSYSYIDQAKRRTMPKLVHPEPRSLKAPN